MPSGLLERAIEAHGGMERWRSAEALEGRVRAGGPVFFLKGRGLGRRAIDAVVSTSSMRVELRGNPDPGTNGIFEAGAVRIEGPSAPLASRDPEQARRHAGRFRRWDDLDELYFVGYAMWQYVSAPFAFAEPGFELAEGPPWREGDEQWRRLVVRFPDSVPGHSPVQTYFIDESGLLRRLDYTAEVFGRWAHAAHYLHDHRELDGIVVPTRRRVHPRGPGGRPVRPITLIGIEVETFGRAS